MIITRSDIDTLKVDLYDSFQQYIPAETMKDRIFNTQDTEAAYEKMVSGSTLGKLVELPDGNDIVFEKPSGGLTAYGKIRSFAKGYQMTEDAVDDAGGLDGARNIFVAKAREWANSYVAAQEEFAANIFNFGGFLAGHEIYNNSIPEHFNDPGGDLLWDGKPFFNLAGNLRTAQGGTTHFNGHALAPTLPNLQTMYLNGTVTNARDEYGKAITIRPNVLLSSGALRFTLFPLLNSQQVPGGNNNDMNPLYKLLDPIEWGSLTDTDAFYMGVAKKGLEWRDRKKPVIDFYQDPKNRTLYCTCKARWGAWVSDWRYWQASQYSTA